MAEQVTPQQIPKDNILLDVQNLKKYFPIQKGFARKVVGYVKAVDDVSFFVREAETLGLVGESGCGKTTAGRTIIRLYEPTGGKVFFKSRIMSQDGQPQMINLTDMNRQQMRPIYEEIAMVFQDPVNSLNPRMSVSEIISEPMVIRALYQGRER
jgi:ABC-type oligopeptide transport system ATPase subunit